MYYNFVRVHQSLRVTPAMEAGITARLWTVEDIVRLLDRGAGEVIDERPVAAGSSN